MSSLDLAVSLNQQSSKPLLLHSPAIEDPYESLNISNSSSPVEPDSDLFVEDSHILNVLFFQAS